MIATARLIVRPWRAEDRAAYLATCNTPAVTRFLDGPQSEEAIDAGLAHIAASQRDHGFCFWAVERRADSAFLGYCGLKRAMIEGTPVADDVEIGWRLAEHAWGQGYAGEAARACLDWAWANRAMSRVVSFTIPANRPSWAVMERVGMTRRPDLDFAHPACLPDHPLRAHISYAIERPDA